MLARQGRAVTSIPDRKVSRSVAPPRGSLCLDLLVSTDRGKAVRMPWQRTAPSPSPGPDPGPGASPDPGLSPDPVSPALLAWAQAVDASQLSEKTVKQAENYLRDYRHMNYLARREFGFRLRSVIEAQVSPSPPSSVASLDVIATALSARRRQLGIG